MSLTDSLPISAPSRLATPRSSLPTMGPNVGLVMRALGLPPLPWQQQVLDVALEVNPDGTWRYKTIVLTVPRQAGKTALIGGVLVHRALAFPSTRAWYTAQSGVAALDAYTEWVGMTQRAMPDRFKYRMSQGRQTMGFEPNDSTIRIFPPTPDSLHGRQGDIVVLDECFAHDEERGDAIMQAVVPTQATRPMKQTWLVSTAGSADALWWKRWVEKGRASLDDPDSGICFFEWSAAPDIDVTRPESWPLFHPAYGLTQSEDSFRTALDQMGPEQFDRAFANRWPASGSSWRESWADCGSQDRIPPDAEVVFGLDSNPNNSQAAITAAARLPDGRVAVELVEHRHETNWVAERAIELHKRHGAKLCIARNGPLAYLIPDIERAGVPVEKVAPIEVGDSVARFQSAVIAQRVTHPSDPRLDGAVANCIDATAERPMWHRRVQVRDISPIVAAALAVWGVEAGPPLPQVL